MGRRGKWRPRCSTHRLFRSKGKRKTRSIAAGLSRRFGGLRGGHSVYSLPLDYYNTLPGKISGVGAADALRVAKQHLAPEKMVVVAVGDRAKIQPELEKLGLGPVEVRDVNGQAVAAGGGNQ